MWPRATAALPLASYSMLELARITGRFYFRLSPNIFGAHWRAYKWLAGRPTWTRGSVSFIYSLAHCFPRVSICESRVGRPIVKCAIIDQHVRTFGRAPPRADNATCRHQSVVIEHSNRLTITRPDWHHILDILFGSSLCTDKFLFDNEYEGFRCQSKYLLGQCMKCFHRNWNVSW